MIFIYGKVLRHKAFAVAPADEREAVAAAAMRERLSLHAERYDAGLVIRVGDTTIATSEGPGDHLTIDFTDQGIGIDKKFHDRIFERFYRAEKSRTRRETTGFGLGLSIATWIVERHGGRIEVNSQEGKGTTFAIWMPLYNNDKQ